MTPREVETMIRNLDARTTRTEQILPTLVTKEDLSTALSTGLNSLEARLTPRIDDVGRRIDDVGRQVLVLHEDVKSDIRLVAEHLAHVMQVVNRLDHRG